MKIVVGVDGSEHSLHAIDWCAKYAGRLGAEVVAVHAIEIPAYPAVMGALPTPIYTSEDHEKLHRIMVEQWCGPLADANVDFRVVLTEGYPAKLIGSTADAEHADLVVVGRRGRGGFTELVLGSTSNQLVHHVGRALVIVP